MRRRRRALLVLAGAVGALVAAFALGSLDRCGEWPAGPPRLVHIAGAVGVLRVGAAEVPLAPALPVPLAGYGPLREKATRAGPLHARALLVEVGGSRVGMVAFDVLLISPALHQAVLSEVEALRLDGLWLVATHTHSSFGGYDARLVPQLASVGRFDEAALAGLASAGVQALQEALGALAPARLELGEVTVSGLSAPRSGEVVDSRVTRARFLGVEGRSIAQLVVLSAHPTLAPRDGRRLEPDYPGRFAEAARRRGEGVTLVVQGAAGNASFALPAQQKATPVNFAVTRVTEVVTGLPTVAEQEVGLKLATVEVALPRPSAAHLTSPVLVPVTENALCASSDRRTKVSALQLGTLRLLALAFEPSHASGLALEAASGAGRLVSLVNGYQGYVELEALARAGGGESRRQYFAPELLGRLEEGAALAGEALGWR